MSWFLKLPLGAVALIALALFATAASARVNVSGYSLGFEGKHHAGAWTPVSVTIENLPAPNESPADLEVFYGILQLEVGSSSQNRYTIQRHVEVAAGTKRFTLYAPLRYNANPELRVYKKRYEGDASGREIMKTSLKALTMLPREPLIVIADESPEVFHQPLPFSRRREQVARVDPETLPDQWIGYQSASLVVFPKLSRNSLDVDQRAALLKWVEGGGRVLICGGRDGVTFNNSFLEKAIGLRFSEELLPTVVPSLWDNEGGTQTNDRPTSMELTAILGDSGRALLKDGALSIARRTPIGNGFVDVWAFDGRDRQQINSPIARSLWTAALADSDKPYEHFRAPEYLESHMQLAKSSDPNNIPRIWLIVIILLVYFVVVGPVNFLYLAKQKKLEWAWITLPVIILGFTIGVYQIGKWTKSNQRFFRHYNRVEARLNQPSGMLRSTAAVWSPDRRLYSFEFDEEAVGTVAQDGWADSGWALDRDKWLGIDDSRRWAFQRELQFAPLEFGGQASKIRIEGNTVRVSENEIEQWSSQMIDSHDILPLGKGVSGDIVWRHDAFSGVNQVEGVVQNETPYTFDELFLVIYSSGRDKFERGAGYKITTVATDWKPGDTLELDPQVYGPDLSRSSSNLQARHPSLPGQKPEYDYRRNTSRSLGAAFFQQLDTRDYIPFDEQAFPLQRTQNGAAWLVGWCTQNVSRVSMTPKEDPDAFDTSQYSLFSFELEPRGARSLRFGVNSLRPELVVQDKDVDLPDSYGIGGSSRAFGLSNTYLVYSFQFPAGSIPIKPTSMSIKWMFKNQTQNQRIRCHIYNFRTRQWFDTVEWDRNVPASRVPLKVNGRGNPNAWPTVYEMYNSRLESATVNVPDNVAQDYVNPISGEILIKVISDKTDTSTGYSGASNELYNLDIDVEATPIEVQL